MLINQAEENYVALGQTYVMDSINLNVDLLTKDVHGKVQFIK
jgi:hypothetical protein